jgi:lysine-N-methylase
LREFLDVAQVAVNVEVPRNLERLSRPGWIGRLLFRTTLSTFLRKDQGCRRGFQSSSRFTLRFALMGAIWRMVRGRGKLPRMQVGLPDRTLEDFEQPMGPLPAEAIETLERYYTIKTESLQFCGPIFYRMPFWAGFEALALTLPMIYWITRGYRELGPTAAVEKAITLVDEHFGFNPRLGQLHHRLGVRILGFRQELDRLIAWYAR